MRSTSGQGQPSTWVLSPNLTLSPRTLLPHLNPLLLHLHHFPIFPQPMNQPAHTLQFLEKAKLLIICIFQILSSSHDLYPILYLDALQIYSYLTCPNLISLLTPHLLHFLYFHSQIMALLSTTHPLTPDSPLNLPPSANKFGLVTYVYISQSCYLKQRSPTSHHITQDSPAHTS